MGAVLVRQHRSGSSRKSGLTGLDWVWIWIWSRVLDLDLERVCCRTKTAPIFFLDNIFAWFFFAGKVWTSSVHFWRFWCPYPIWLRASSLKPPPGACRIMPQLLFKGFATQFNWKLFRPRKKIETIFLNIVSPKLPNPEGFWITRKSKEMRAIRAVVRISLQGVVGM